MDKLYWAKVKEDAIIPTKRDEDAGYDMYPCFPEDYIEIKPHETKIIPLGIASAFDSNYVMILKERGSTGTKGMGQRSGIIDSGYRGEYGCPITNLNDYSIVIAKKEFLEAKDERGYVNKNKAMFMGVLVYPYEKAICQGVLVVMPQLEQEELDYESLKAMESLRGTGVLGSSGK